MSKIFDALRRAGLEGVEDLGPVAIDPPVIATEPAPIPFEPAQNGRPVLSVAPDSGLTGLRSAPLRLSALSPVFPFDQGHSAASEQYRIIRTKILHHPKAPRSIVVSSPRSGDGKTITSINVAASLALKPDLSVLLVDADLRRSQVANVLGIPPAPGLTDVLAGTAPLDKVLVRVEQFPNLWVLPGGSRAAHPAELLDSPEWRALSAEFRTRFNYTIIDATPVAAVTDYELVQLVCDGVILVARPDHTERNACKKAIETVPKEKLIGVVLNCVEDWFLVKSNGYGYYQAAK